MTTKHIDEISSDSLRTLMQAAGAQFITFIRASEASADVKLYRDEHGGEYITDGADAYAEVSDGFAEMNAQWLD